MCRARVGGVAARLSGPKGASVNTSPAVRGAPVRLGVGLLLFVLLSPSLRPPSDAAADVLTAGVATALVTTANHSLAAQPAAPVQPTNSSPLIKQFEETAYYLKDVDFISAGVGWAVGHPHWDQTRLLYTGTILKTTDGGQTWDAQLADTLATLRNVDFVDANNGWAVGTEGAILHTADGGAHWVRQTVASTDEFRGVAFANATQGWATSFATTHYDVFGDPDDWRGSIWHTADGGAHWARQSLPANAGLLNRIDFIDAQRGWAVGVKYTGDDQFGHPQHAGVVYRTADGGQSWTELYSPGANVVLNGVEWIDAEHGWVVGFPTLSSMSGGFTFHTADGGQTWQRQTPGGFFAPLWDVQFIDADRGYTVGFNYVGAAGPPVYRTLDGGATWQAIQMRQHEAEGLFTVAVVGDQVVAVGDHDYVARSTRPWDDFTPTPCIDGVCLFTQAYLNTHYVFHDVFFANANDGWAVGSRSYLPNVWGQVIFHTADGGRTWAVQYELVPPAGTTFSTLRLASVSFVDSQTGWAVGASGAYRLNDRLEHHGAILYTDDGGQQWQEQGQELYTNWDLEFFAVQFLDAQNGWALARGNPAQHGGIFLAHTTDGGDHWNWVDTGQDGEIGIGYESPLGSVEFSDAQHGVAVGGLSQIVATSDGGAHWFRPAVSCGAHTCYWTVYAVAFADERNGWAGGEGAFHTTDGGATWVHQPMPVHGRIQDIQFLDDRAGWLATDRGEMWLTSNSGLRWQRLPGNPGYALMGLHFVEPERGWFVGDGGTILRLDAERWPVQEEVLLPFLKR